MSLDDVLTYFHRDENKLLVADWGYEEIETTDNADHRVDPMNLEYVL